MPDEMFTNDIWTKYGLSSPDGDADIVHWFIAIYLELNPEIAKRYLIRQPGFQYFDILKMIENRIGRKLIDE